MKYISILIASSALFMACSSEQKEIITEKGTPIPVTIATPVVGDGQTIQMSGRVEAQEQIQISTRFMGYITMISVKEGSVVKKGDLLIKINSEELLAKREQVKAMVQEVESAYQVAKLDYERFKKLYETNHATVKELENVKLQYESISAKREAALQMQREVDANFQYVNITAPFSGVVTQKFVNEGSIANPGMPLLSLEASTGFQIATSVGEQEVTQLITGQKVNIYISSIKKSMEGVISQISPSSVNSGGQYMVKILFTENTLPKLYAGMYASVSTTSKSTNQGTHRIEVDTAAIIQKDQLIGLYTLNDEGNKALLRWVKTGQVQQGKVEIISGLNATEKYIVSADGLLRDGSLVAVK